MRYIQSNTIAPTTASRMLQMEKPLRPVPAIMFPKKPPRNAPTIPMRIVTIIPPGSLPGMIAFAIAPAMRPRTIHARIDICKNLPSGVNNPRRPIATRIPDGAARHERSLPFYRPLAFQNDGAFLLPRRRSAWARLRRQAHAPSADVCPTASGPCDWRARATDAGRAPAARWASPDPAGHRRSRAGERRRVGLEGGRMDGSCPRAGIRVRVWGDNPDRVTRPTRHAAAARGHFYALAASASEVLRPESRRTIG